MNSHKTEGRGPPLGYSDRGTREQKLVKKEAGKSSWNWPLLFISISVQSTRNIEECLNRSSRTRLHECCDEEWYL